MKKEIVQLPKIPLVGTSLRTSYQNETSESGKIGPCVQNYFHQKLFDKITGRTKPFTTFCVYTEYESDFRGAYTYFIGEEVSPTSPVPNDFSSLEIQPQTYVKFTTEAGPMPTVLINAWQEIWKMTSEELGGKRCYHADFEVYDDRASDHQNVVLDIYIGIEQ